MVRKDAPGAAHGGAVLCMTTDGHEASTTPLTFSNAMRTFYSFVYQPTMSTEREHEQREYFIKRLVFSEGVTNRSGGICSSR